MYPYSLLKGLVPDAIQIRHAILQRGEDQRAGITNVGDQSVSLDVQRQHRCLTIPQRSQFGLEH